MGSSVCKLAIWPALVLPAGAGRSQKPDCYKIVATVGWISRQIATSLQHCNCCVCWTNIQALLQCCNCCVCWMNIQAACYNIDTVVCVGWISSNVQRNAKHMTWTVIHCNMLGPYNSIAEVKVDSDKRIDLVIIECACLRTTLKPNRWSIKL